MATATATRPASGDAPLQRDGAAHVPKEAVPPAKEPQAAQATHRVREAVAAVAAQIDSYLRSHRRELQFSIDSESGETVISVRDVNTGELIRQIPSEEALRLSQALDSLEKSLIDIYA